MNEFGDPRIPLGMMHDYHQCGECWEWIRVNDDGTEDICILAHPDAEIDYEEHVCQSWATNEDIPKVAHILESEEENANT